MLETNTVDGFVWESLWKETSVASNTIIIVNKVICILRVDFPWFHMGLALLFAAVRLFCEAMHFVVFHVNIYIQSF